MLHREEINKLTEYLFIEHKSRQRKIRIHAKGDGNEFTKWVDFDYYFDQTPWCVLERCGEEYECVLLEWLVNVYSKQYQHWSWK